MLNTVRLVQIETLSGPVLCEGVEAITDSFHVCSGRHPIHAAAD
jgi:hypothetical protein